MGLAAVVLFVTHSKSAAAEARIIVVNITPLYYPHFLYVFAGTTSTPRKAADHDEEHQKRDS